MIIWARLYDSVNRYNKNLSFRIALCCLLFSVLMLKVALLRRKLRHQWQVQIYKNCLCLFMSRDDTQRHAQVHANICNAILVKRLLREWLNARTTIITITIKNPRTSFAPLPKDEGKPSPDRLGS